MGQAFARQGAGNDNNNDAEAGAYRHDPRAGTHMSELPYVRASLRWKQQRKEMDVKKTSPLHSPNKHILRFLDPSPHACVRLCSGPVLWRPLCAWRPAVSRAAPGRLSLWRTGRPQLSNRPARPVAAGASRDAPHHHGAEHVQPSQRLATAGMCWACSNVFFFFLFYFFYMISFFFFFFFFPSSQRVSFAGCGGGGGGGIFP